MNMPAESSPFAFPKLDGSNYTSWKEDMKVVLMDRGCWSFIIEDKPCPEQATEKEKFEYDWRKQRCYTTIYQGIERKFLPLIRYTTDGKEAWNILKTNFEPTSKARLAVLIDEFFELKFNPVEETIGIFCKRVDEKKTQVKEAGFEIPELLIALQLIRRLPAEYDHLVQTLYRFKDEEFNHLEVEKQLVNENGRIQLKQKDLNLDYTEDAYTVGSFRLQETRKKSSERSGAVLDPSRNPGQYRKIHYPKGMGPSCEFCSRKGHDASKCYKKQNKEKKQAFASETSFCGTNQAFGVSTDWNHFLIDTAATSHFCYERVWFKNFFETFLRDLGIKIEKTSFYTPELNGIAERFNRSSMEAVRTMLQDSGLQPRFWAEALHAYVHTKNRCSHKLTEGKTPMEIWSGHKPSIRHCRTFGSLAYVYVPTVNRNKLQPKAKIGILVGYAVNRRGYRVWLPKERKVVESIHIKIDETKNGVKTLFGKVKHYDYDIYQLDQNLNNDSDCRAQDEKFSSPEKPSSLDISTWIRLEKPRTKSKRIDVYYYPPSKERLRSINDVKIYCQRNKLEFDPNQFNFKPSTTNTRFEEKSECHNETSLDSVDEASFVNDIFQHEIYITEIPKTFKETQISPDKEKWDKAMSEEIKLMQNKKVWDLVEPKSNMKIKHDEKNNVKKYKSRLVAQGFKQRPGVDFTDVFAPLVNFDIIKFLFVLLVCILGWNHCQIDVKGAYLYGNLDIPIYMQQPEGFAVKGCEHYVCRLHINEILFGLGFHQNELYNGLYTKSNCILLVYVDDIVVFSKSQSDLENSILNIKIKLEITELRPVRYLLGVNFEPNFYQEGELHYL
ncbi:Retrovirus-related Pol polyprotein from transposon TNT 1-94 [Araneus ventricosus]|uniref:Retrovirus-related Pol polyprotein from transposon TNT 1-94 n=1 Tax=Araneus ventricosus TaxID=182803 RepID=A0A4Y2QVE7_ARAVE|nr:Retrovirus-related Pol polyprotein from transposon TNT 1-94 [Araneus ventricosus]GBN67235.1 Retrovirus-related Pol polyprotein from transposon TNT 1-94 [Araneus ventricosus]